ncbi:hypothetical protein A9996_02160 [Gelidibacter algens]|nr:hypothetical protein A9996_02160 [Gelidibacter algens]
MKMMLLALVCFCTIQISQAQEEDGVVSLSLPVRNSLTFNRYTINPAFSFVREQNKYISLYNKREWVQFEDAPQTYLASYSGRFAENIGAGLGLFQQNYGVLTTFGGVLNFAYNARLERDSNLTFGLNLGVYKSGVNAANVVTNFPDPSLDKIPSNLLLTVNPGINYGTTFLDFGVSINNVVLYNVQSSELIQDDPRQTIQAHVMYTGYFGRGGFFDEAKFSGLLRSEFGKETTTISGIAMLTVPKGIWAQVGYNTLYGASAGLGLNITSQIAIEYNFEKALGDLTDFGPSHEITLAYKFKKRTNYDYSDEDEVSAIFSSDNKRVLASSKPAITDEAKEQMAAEATAKREEIKERAQDRADMRAQLAADAKALQDKQAAEAAEAKAKQEAELAAQKALEAQAKLDAENKAKIEPVVTPEQQVKARLATVEKAKADAKSRAEAQAKFVAEAQADIAAKAKAKAAQEKSKTETQAQLDADLKAKVEAAAKIKAEAEAKVKLAAQEKAKADAQAKLAAEAKAKTEAEAAAKLLAETKAKEAAAAKVALAAQEKAKAEAIAKADAQAKLEAEAKAKSEAEAAAKLAAETKAKEAAAAKVALAAQEKAKAEAKAKADAQAKLAAEAKAKTEAEAAAKVLADAKAKTEVEAKAKLAALEKAKADEKAKAEAQAKLATAVKAKAEAETAAKLAAETKAKADQEAQAKLAIQEESNAAEENVRAEAQAKLVAQNKAKAEIENTLQLAVAAQAAHKAAQVEIAAQTKKSAEKKVIENPTDAIGISMKSLADLTETSKINQQQLLAKFSEVVASKDKDLKALREENDLSEQGIYKAPRPFKSISEENKALEALKIELDNSIETNNSRIKELETLYAERSKVPTLQNDEVTLYYQKALKNLKAEQAKALQTREQLTATLKQINEATEFERKRRIKRAVYTNEEDKFVQDRTALKVIKQNTVLSPVPLKASDFDFGEEQSNSIQILKNIKNTESGFYVVVAVHNDVAKRDAFLTKAVAAGQSNIDFFYDVNTSKYFIYYQKLGSIEAANDALKTKGNQPYNGKLSIIKIEN